jgi:putative DNA primase/helicase
VKTTDAARGKWYGILRHFGIDDSFLRDKHGPCPLCAGKDRFRWDDRGGSGSYYCNTCGSGDGMKLVIEWTGKDFKQVAGEIDGIVGNLGCSEPKSEKPNPRIRLNEVAAKRAPIDSINPVRAYLKSRGLKPVQGIEYCESIRYWSDGNASYYPAMICLVRDVNGNPVTWHVTHLTNKGDKAPVDAVRKILPPVSPLQGAVIRLGGMAETIGIAEGVETQMHNIPCWSAINATLLEQFTPPEGVKTVVIYGDNDTNYVGQKSAYALASRLALMASREQRELSIEVYLPTQAGTDFADELQQLTRQAL